MRKRRWIRRSRGGQRRSVREEEKELDEESPSFQQPQKLKIAIMLWKMSQVCVVKCLP